jgi:ankyrin repeat protein
MNTIEILKLKNQQLKKENKNLTKIILKLAELISNNPLGNYAKVDENSALTWACRNNNEAIVKLLLETNNFDAKKKNTKNKKKNIKIKTEPIVIIDVDNNTETILEECKSNIVYELEEIETESTIKVIEIPVYKNV